MLTPIFPSLYRVQLTRRSWANVCQMYTFSPTLSVCIVLVESIYSPTNPIKKHVILELIDQRVRTFVDSLFGYVIIASVVPATSNQLAIIDLKFPSSRSFAASLCVDRPPHRLDRAYTRTSPFLSPTWWIASNYTLRTRVKLSFMRSVRQIDSIQCISYMDIHEFKWNGFT